MNSSYDIERSTIDSIEPDYIPQKSPVNVANNGLNIRYSNMAMERASGYLPIFGTTLYTPIYLIGIRQSNAFIWLYASESNIGAVDSASNHYDITPLAGVAATKVDNWSGGAINGLAYMVSPLTDPIYWDGSTSNKMTTLPNWPASTKVRCIRSYKNFLIALGVDGPAGFFGNMVKWSASADSGDIPQSWDISDPTLDAGEATLSTTPGNVIDCLPLNDYNVIYKDDSTHLMRYIGGQFIFSFSDLFLTSGIMGRDCVVEVNGTHVVLTKDDLISHNGSEFKSIATNRVRDTIFKSINTNYASSSFLAHNRKQDEIWICIPTGDSDCANLAVIWNYKFDKFGFQSLPDVPYISPGLIDITTDALTWNTDSDTWDADQTRWTQQFINDISNDLVFPLSTNLMQLDTGSTDNGVDISASIEKNGIQITPENEIALVVRVIPNIVGTTGDVVKIKVGSQYNIGDPIAWGAQSDFTIGTSKHHDCLVKGRYMSIQVASEGGDIWSLHSIGVEYNSGGRF